MVSRTIKAFYTGDMALTTPPAAQGPTASPLFLREDEIRRGIELLFFGHQALFAMVDPLLDEAGLGRAHFRALYFIARRPEITVTALLDLLGITKQSLGRVLDELVQRQWVVSAPGRRDRRQKLLRLTTQGAALEERLFDALRARIATAYQQAGQGSVTGYWRVLEGLIPPDDLARVFALQMGR
jgi:DNA-binding MarR family transcriptional regulator